MEYYAFFHHHREPLPSFDGFITVELSDRPIRYHMQPLFPCNMDAQECHTMAMAACRIACNCADAIRGKLSVDRLQRALTAPCLERLQTMHQLLDLHMLTHPDIKAKFCYLPTVPNLIDGMITSDRTMELAVFMTIGKENLRVNMKFRFIGSRWMCVFADLG
ncbi:hypothetical protein BISA_0922 [Bifidobacterium saguini DSM 23967]|uniref:Uncharacterized protein n=4 Tax=Bifidobacterium TaxID=1678 RepID=A0A087DAG9_9BIFI|nr:MULTISPECIES: hypothetical protein [Bifidobacterium]KFI92519.1 hypothetical protein BISA_0922 [Bifidobacterium saguini DSM 23967]PLS23947.1 hypothetical protein Tam1G_1990 [Bifidobacterium imperatoris]